MWKGKRKQRNGRGSSSLFVVVLLVIVAVCLSSITTGVLGGVGKKKEGADEQGPDPVERALGLAGLKNQWDAITSWLKLKVMDFGANLGIQQLTSVTEPELYWENTVLYILNIMVANSCYGCLSLCFFPLLKLPREEKSYGKSGSSRPEEVVKEAVKKTVGTGKDTVEHAAKSAAEVVDDAVHRAKEKVKKAVSSTKKSSSGDHEDL